MDPKKNGHSSNGHLKDLDLLQVLAKVERLCEIAQGAARRAPVHREPERRRVRA